MLRKIDEIAAPGYIPTVDDILRTRVRTTGINEITYTFSNMNFTYVLSYILILRQQEGKKKV
jgi:hypothetical protein